MNKKYNPMWRILAVVLLLFALVAVAVPVTQTSVQAAMAAPTLNIGDTWEYTVTNGGEISTFKGTVVSAGVDGYEIDFVFDETERKEKASPLNLPVVWMGEMTRTYNADLVWTDMWTIVDISGYGELDWVLTGEIDYPAPLWPLTAGTEWTADYVLDVGGLLEKEYPLTVKVEGMEEVTVPAGTFDCHKIVYYQGDTVRVQEWFSEEVKAPVKRIEELFWHGSDIWELNHIPSASVAIGCALGVPPDGTADVDITIDTDDPDGIGSATITLTCDSSAVTVDTVLAGDLGGVDWHTVGGTTTMTAATGSSPGPTGNVTFATVRLHAVGSAGQSSDLDIQVASLYDGMAGDPHQITPSPVTDCTFSIATNRLEGDVHPMGSGNGVIDSADALLIAQHIVGTITLTGNDFLAADVNDDRTVDSADIQLVAQYIVSTITAFPGGTYIP